MFFENCFFLHGEISRRRKEGCLSSREIQRTPNTRVSRGICPGREINDRHFSLTKKKKKKRKKGNLYFSNEREKSRDPKKLCVPRGSWSLGRGICFNRGGIVMAYRNRKGDAPRENFSHRQAKFPVKGTGDRDLPSLSPIYVSQTKRSLNRERCF